MSIERIVMATAGIFVTISAALAHFVSPYFLFFTGFVGLNLVQSAFTGFCPLAIMLKKIGVKPGLAFK